jgi:hypothetical protein
MKVGRHGTRCRCPSRCFSKRTPHKPYSICRTQQHVFLHSNSFNQVLVEILVPRTSYVPLSTRSFQRSSGKVHQAPTRVQPAWHKVTSHSRDQDRTCLPLIAHIPSLPLHLGGRYSHRCPTDSLEQTSEIRLSTGHCLTDRIWNIRTRCDDRSAWSRNDS